MIIAGAKSTNPRISNDGRKVCRNAALVSLFVLFGMLIHRRRASTTPPIGRLR